MTVDSALLEARRFHQVIEGATLVPSLVENRCRRLHDLFPGLLAFGHKVAFALRPVGLFHHSSSLLRCSLGPNGLRPPSPKKSRGELRPIGPIGITSCR